MTELRTLGVLQLRDARGRDLCEKVQPKRLALLIYLSHAPRRFHRRDSLLALFWPELGPRSARNSLRQGLYSVRRAVGTGVITGRGYEEIGVTDSLWSDVVAFESAIRSGDMEEALRLYTGDFLEGFHIQCVAPELELWLDGERGRLRTQAVRAALRLADRDEAKGDLSAAVRWARVAAGLDADDENIVQRLIELLDAAGDRAGALRTYDAYARRAREEYDLDPTSETRQLISEIRNREEPPTSASAPPEPEILEPPTTFIGRVRELSALEDLLHDPRVRLVTLTGLGGCGKTRLALQCARRVKEHFQDGLAFVGLDEIRDTEETIAAIARGLGLKEERGRGPREALHAYLAPRQLILLLDGFELMRGAGPTLLKFLQAAPRLKILITSRAPLKVSGEREFQVPPLSLPVGLAGPSLEFPLNSEAVALFVDRARAVRPDFRMTVKNMDAVAEICCRLDGLPLAIELAAARVHVLTPQDIAQRLEERFAFLTTGSPDQPQRHRTLEAAIAWSCELLDENERALFRRLGIFHNGFGLDLAEPLFEAHGIQGVDLIDHLATLVDYGLVRQLEMAGESRFEMLDTVHAYARKLLVEKGEKELWQRRHAKRVLAWVEEGECSYCRPEQDSWLRSLEREHDNVRAAIRWALRNGDSAIAVRLGAAVWPFWSLRGHGSEARAWLEEILTTPGRAPREARAKLLVGASWTAAVAAQHRKAAELARRSMTLYRAIGDTAGRIRALETLGFVRLEAGDVETARSAFHECLEESKATGDERREAIALEALGQIALAGGDNGEAASFLKQSVRIAKRIGQTGEVGQGLLFLGNIAYRSGDLEHAMHLYDEALTIYREAGQKMNIASVLSCMGRVHVDRKEIRPARVAYAEALTLFQEVRYIRGIAQALLGCGSIALAEHQVGRAAKLLGGIEALLQSVTDRLSDEDSKTFEYLEASARDQLGRPGLATRWAEGCALSETALVALATAEEPSPRRRPSPIRKGQSHHSTLPA